MNNAQRDLLVKAFADIAKGLFVGVLLAAGTEKVSLYGACWGVLFAVFFHLTAHNIAGGIRSD